MGSLRLFISYALAWLPDTFHLHKAKLVQYVLQQSFD